mmetsp:Transcript_19469/g.49730  ORF Transcript_19469/g.49730 Transcript_19469/m.49730 type:complete len:263 (+) Transcript_19469:1218-2006(+)
MRPAISSATLSIACFARPPCCESISFMIVAAVDCFPTELSVEARCSLSKIAHGLPYWSLSWGRSSIFSPAVYFIFSLLPIVEPLAEGCAALTCTRNGDPGRRWRSPSPFTSHQMCRSKYPASFHKYRISYSPPCLQTPSKSMEGTVAFFASIVAGMKRAFAAASASALALASSSAAVASALARASAASLESELFGPFLALPLLGAVVDEGASAEAGGFFSSFFSSLATFIEVACLFNAPGAGGADAGAVSGVVAVLSSGFRR